MKMSHRSIRLLRRARHLALGLFVAVSGSLLAWADDQAQPSNAPATADVSRGDFGLTVNGLQALQNGFHYEGWVIVEGAPLSTGKFNIRPDGTLTGFGNTAVLNGNTFKPEIPLAQATAVVITIEPSGDRDQRPALTKVLAGPVANGKASLTPQDAQAIGVDFGSASGQFILATPTDGRMDTNETSGIWFLNPNGGNPTPGLSLPMLPRGWRYEGWVVFFGMPLTTGKFRAVDRPDEMALFSGPRMGPPFPGEDFLRNALRGLPFPTDLSGKGVVITVEPDPDDSVTPFQLAPLRGTVPTPGAPVTPYNLENQSAGLATGQATLTP
jgi:hypothetical protein